MDIHVETDRQKSTQLQNLPSDVIVTGMEKIDIE